MARRESREEEYIRRMRERGYEPTLAGMDDDDIEWELDKMDGKNPLQEPQPAQPLNPTYRPADPAMVARIYRQMGRPYDASLIPEKERYYLNGWDNGEDDDRDTLVEKWPQGKSPLPQGREHRPGEPFDPWKNVWKLDWGPEGSPADRPRPRTGYQPGWDGVTRVRTMEFRPGRDSTAVAEYSGDVGNTNLRNNAKGYSAVDLAVMGGETETDDRQETTGSGVSQSSPQKYNQDWYDSYIYRSPEVLGARTRAEREAAIKKLINSEAGEELRRNYIKMHGNENDAEIAMNNDVKYIVNSMDFNDQYAAHVKEAQAKNVPPVSRERKQQDYEKYGTLERQYLGSGVKFDIADDFRSKAEKLRTAGFGKQAAEYERIAGVIEAQAKEDPNWAGNTFLYYLMKYGIKLPNTLWKAINLPIKKDPLGENKIGETMLDLVK